MVKKTRSLCLNIQDSKFLISTRSFRVPKHCNDFYVGGGGFSNRFNSGRLLRIAKRLGLKHGGVRDLGSTWYSTPEQIRLASYLTLFGIGTLALEEYSNFERTDIGVAMWPHWHYGVILLYGQSLMMNHLIGARQMNIIRLEKHIDHVSDNSDSVFNIIHIHVFQGCGLFSKKNFRDGDYDKFDVTKHDTTEARYYAMKMALLGKSLSSQQMLESFHSVLEKYPKH